VTFAAVGSLLQTITTSLTVAPTATGQLVLVEVVAESNTVFCNGISGGNSTWVQLGTNFLGTVTDAYFCSVFAGKSTATGSAAATLTFSGTTPVIRCAGQIFSSTVGSWALDGSQGNLNSAGTNTSPSLTPAGAGDLYFGYFIDEGTATAGATSGYTYDVDAHSNGLCFNPACTSAAQAPVWGDSGLALGVAVLLREAAVATAAAAGAGSVTAKSAQSPTAAVAAAGAVAAANAAVPTGTAAVAAAGAAAAATPVVIILPPAPAILPGGSPAGVIPASVTSVPILPGSSPGPILPSRAPGAVPWPG
jgi:hypothetical protein